jgi:hypothetical protein
MEEPKPEDYLFLPVDQVAAPVKGVYFQRYADAWWAVHPDKGLVFYNPRRGDGRRRHSYWGAPQCNTDERIARGVSRDHLPFPVEVRKFPVVFVQVNISDYA